jgi:tight adherence protein B
MTDLLPTNWLPALLVFVAVGLAVVSVAFLIESMREVRKRRDFRRQLSSATTRTENATPTAGSVMLPQEETQRWLEPLLAVLPQGRDLGLLLAQADLDWSVGSFLTICFGLAVAFGVSGMVVSQGPLPPVLAAVFGFMLPFIYVRRLKKKRIAAFEEEFPEAVDLLGRSIRAGHAFATGLKVVAEESEDPLGKEFRQVFEEQRFGLSVEDSMLGLADRIDLIDVRIFVTAILVQREVGGNLAEILDKIAYTVRERFMLQRQVRVYTAQGRLTGYLLAGLPIGVGSMIYMLNPEYMSILFTEPMGRLMIAGAVVLQVIGFFAIRRIIDIEI